MPHSLRAKLSGLRYKGILEDKDYKRLCKALDNENVLEQIRAEIEGKIVKRPWLDFEDMERDRNDAFLEVLDIIDKYKAERSEE